MIKYISLCILMLVVISSCKNASNLKDDKTTFGISNVPVDVDKSFDTFILHFSQDSIFQINRIKFPMRVQELELNDSSEMVWRTINKSDHRTMNFSPPKFKDNIDNYTQKIKPNGNKATIEIRGIDNGIIMDFLFEKIGGRWMLVSWIDSST